MWRDFTATSAQQERHIGNYQLLNTLGQGSYGTVRLGWHNLTGTAVAVKAIRSRHSHSGPQGQLPQEAECMAVLHHPHIVQLFEVIVTKDMVYLIMEHVSGRDLRDHLQVHGMLSEDEARGIFRQLVLAVHHCHERGVIHRDLKPSNILLDADMRVKLTDFGLSTFFNQRKLSALCGNPFYAAPETFLAKECDGPPVDVWSLGVLLYRMVTGHVPFEEEDLTELKKAVLSGKYAMPFHLSLQLQNLLTQILTLNPKERSSLEFLLSSLWLDIDHEEQPKPSHETPPSEDLDPWVTQEMVDMGFQRDQIEHAVTNKTYDYIMGTYLLLNTKKPKVQYHTIRVKPFAPPDLNTNDVPTGEVRPECSRAQQAEQQHKNWKSGKKAAESAGPAASLTPRTDTPGPRPESRIPTPGPRVSLRTATPGPITESRTPSSESSAESRTLTTGPSVESGKASPAPSGKWRKVSPRHSPKSRIPTPRPSPKCRTTSPTLRRKTRTASPPPVQEWECMMATPPPIPELESWSSVPPLLSEWELGTATPQLIQGSESRTTTPPPIPELESWSSVPPLLSEWELGTATPQLIQGSESRTTTPAPIPEEPESCSATPALALESASRTAISTPSPESNAAPSPVPQRGPGVAPSSHSSGGSGNQQQTSQGRRGMARRCWDFFKKLCLRPCKKGRGRRNKVMPL